jgi:alkylation response protein AidB-like acyl-CoA dehydrogenase
VADFTQIRVERDGPVAVVTLDRPEQMNAWTWTMSAELGRAFAQLDADDSCRAIVVTGAGRAFCAGAHLGDGEKTFSGGSTAIGTREDAGRARRATPAHQLNTPIIAAINGAAVGAGLTMTVEWDLRVAGDGVKLGYHGARAPLFNVIGGLGNGWRVSKTTLGNERGGSAATQHVRFEVTLRKLVEECRRRGRTGDPVLRQRLADAHTRIQLIRFGGLRTLASLLDTGDPGPAASINKMLWSELHQDLAELALDVLGADATVLGGRGDGYRPGRWQADFFASRSSTIWGGTAEIQRNIVGERVLGLPREPAVS